jgi:hypothetical protein
MTLATSTEYRIYGDNILECERALHFMAEALTEEPSVEWLPSPLYAPLYKVSSSKGKLLFSAQLFPGYGRWHYDIESHLKQLGAPLREKIDAVILRLELNSKGEKVAVPVLTFEFCGALPAGNNAWQRCGRAIACAYAGVPYLYFAELGGAELDANRNLIAPRWPNPLVPFSYITLGAHTGALSLPIYLPSPSAPSSILAPFADCFGEEEAKRFIKNLLLGTDTSLPLQELQSKATRVVQVLSAQRASVDTLRENEWNQFASQKNGKDKAGWLLQRKLPWNKTITIPTTTTLPQLLQEAIQAGAVAIGAKTLPFCLLSGEGRKAFAKAVSQLYKGRVSTEFITWLQGRDDKALVLTWIAGFKPRGDDSRPDRGLTPLAHMVMGDSGVDYLSIVYGPAQASTWRLFASNLSQLAQNNGLWESIVTLSDAILVDSPTASQLKDIGQLNPHRAAPRTAAVPPLPAATELPNFGEHDVDTTLHTLFANSTAAGVFEAFCNPPGGDWSGISFQNAEDGEIVRWTSLPRVSAAKRPDHVVVFYGNVTSNKNTVLLSIESKPLARNLENNIGPRLKSYVTQLFKSIPNVGRLVSERDWTPYAGGLVSQSMEVYSAGAFQYRASDDLKAIAARSEVDLILAIEFIEGEQKAILHTYSNARGTWLLAPLRKLAARFSGGIEIQEH